MADNEVRMMMSVVPGTMSGFAAMNAGLVSINNVFSSMYRAFDQNFNLIDTILTTTSVVVTQLGIDAMDSFGKFEQGMKIVQMVSGQTAQDIDYLSQKANEFSVQYRTDIDQITDGLQTLGRAGLNSASEQAEVLESGLTTAKLEGRELNSVLEELIQNTALLGGDLKSDQFGETSEYLNDRLVATSMTAPITTHDVSETLKYSGGIAAAAGANLESDQGKDVLDDYLAAIAAFAQKGVTGSIAGTALRAFFNKPATQDSSVTEALGSINLKPEYLWEDDEETMKPISEQIGIITKQMDKLDVSVMDRLQIWSKIVGGKMGQQMMKLHSEDIKELKKDIQGANDASDLAANSMKTYEANIKALGESGASLQRDVGGNLVSIVNPYLEFMNQVAKFLDNPITSSVLAGSIIGFIGFLGSKIKALISLIRGEVSTLISAMNQGINYHLGKGGVQYSDSGVNKMMDPWGGVWTKETTSSSEKSTSSTEKAPKTLAGIYKQVAKDIESNFLKSVEEYQKMGTSKESMAAIHAVRNWSASGSFVSEVEDRRVLASLAEKNLLSEKELGILIGGGSKKSKLNALNADTIEFRYKELTGVFEAEEAEKRLAQERKQAVAVAEAHATSLGKETTEEESAGNAAQKKSNEVKTANTEVSQSVKTTTEEVVQSVYQGGTTVVEEFNALMRGIAASVSQTVPKSSTPITNSNYIPSTYSYADPRMPNISMLPPEYYKDMEEYHRNRRAGIIGAKDTVNRWADAENKYYNPYGNRKHHEAYEDVTSEVEKRIDRKLLDNEIKKRSQSSTADSARADYYSRKVYAASGGIVGVGGIQNQLPTQDAIDASLKANKEAEIKATQESAAAKQEEITKIDQEILAIQNDIDELEWFAIELAKATEALAVLFPPGTGRGTGRGIWDIGLNKKQKQDLEDVHRAHDERVRASERAASTEKDRIKFQKENEKSNLITNKKDIEDIQNKSTKQWKEAQKERINALRTPGTREYIPDPAQIKERAKMNSEAAWLRHQASVQMYRRENEVAQSWKNGSNSLGLNQQANTAFAALMGPRGTLEPPGFKESFKNGLKNVKNISLPSVSNSAFAQTLSKRWNADRSNRFLNFGSGRVGGKVNGVLNMLDAVGGPFMAAMIAIPMIVNYVKGLYESYNQSVKESIEAVKEGYSKRDNAESSLRQQYKEDNPDATDEEIDEKIAKSYITLYDDLTNNHQKYIEKAASAAETPDGYEYDEDKDDGSMKVKEIDAETKTQEELQKNTAALYSATAEINNALTTLTTKMNDKNWGIDGWISKTSDALGSYQDSFTNWGEGSSFNSNGGKFLLTASQADENYAGYTEMAGLMLEDFKDANGELLDGLEIMMGEDADFYSNIMNKSSRGFMEKSAKFASDLGPEQNMRLQASMKYDSKTWKNLGKELAKYENKNKKSYNVDKKVTRIQGLINKLQSTLGAGFDSTKVLQAAYLQIAQDMYSVAQTVFVPLIQQNATSAAQTVAGVGQVYNTTGGTGTNTYNTAAIASSIAAMLGTLALAQAGDAARTQALIGGDIDGDKEVTDKDRKLQELAQNTNSGDEFMREAIKQSQVHSTVKNIGGILKQIPIPGVNALGGGLEGLSPYLGTDRTAADYLTQIYGMTTYMSVHGMDSQKAKAEIDKVIKKAQEEGVDPLSVLRTVGKNWQNPDFVKQVEDAYLASGNEGDGSGSGSGSGSGDKDKDNTGTRKERVDLVLCNRKQIPKLNVNLFKKPPSFTILNKNFKLRDVKINSEDKPKAIMAAIKNSFIDIQKRTDPKIIQDENSVYDPVEATEGKDLPSGSSKTSTNR